MFLAYYVAHTVYLILLSTQNPALRIFGNAMIFFALPLTVVRLIMVSARAFRRQQDQCS